MDSLKVTNPEPSFSDRIQQLIAEICDKKSLVKRSKSYTLLGKYLNVNKRQVRRWDKGEVTPDHPEVILESVEKFINNDALKSQNNNITQETPALLQALKSLLKKVDQMETRIKSLEAKPSTNTSLTTQQQFKDKVFVEKVTLENVHINGL